jgi:hypothetical protein
MAMAIPHGRIEEVRSAEPAAFIPRKDPLNMHRSLHLGGIVHWNRTAEPRMEVKNGVASEPSDAESSLVSLASSAEA